METKQKKKLDKKEIEKLRNSKNKSVEGGKLIKK